MPKKKVRVVIWKLDAVVSTAGGMKSVVESAADARRAAEQYMEKLREEGETILDVTEEGNRMYITLK